MDSELVRRGMAPSREAAREAVLAGKVLVSGAVATKPARLVEAGEAIELTAPPREYVSRGGLKLAAALEAFGVDPDGMRCLDVGSSTGGFTDCLLQRGAREVVALDVGTGQLDWSLRTDPRVRVMERTDVRDADPAELGTFDLVVCDLSFISLRTVMERLAALAGDAPVVALVKPQFEVGRERVGKGGVVRSAELQREAVDAVASSAASCGLRELDRFPSPVPGIEGNQEHFLLLRRGHA